MNIDLNNKFRFQDKRQDIKKKLKFKFVLPGLHLGVSLVLMKQIEMLVRITSFELLFIIGVRDAFRVTPAVTKVDSLLWVASSFQFGACN